MIKIDFTNVLEQEISSVAEIISALENEIKVRVYERDNATTAALSPIDRAVNVRVIAELSSNLRGKKDWLKKLKEKREIDQAEVDQEYEEFTNEITGIDTDYIYLKGDKIKDPHQKAMFDYLMVEFNLWRDKKLDPAHKEATVFYYRALKEMTA